MSTSAEDLRSIALTEFATAGYTATSIHRIADLAGLSKSSVLYHYASKEVLLDAAVAPAIDRMARILDSLEQRSLSLEGRRVFLVEFVDFILEYRREVHMFINQGPFLAGVPTIDRANALVTRLANYFEANTGSIEEKMRFGIALGGAAYMLCAEDTHSFTAVPIDETRVALISVLTGLLLPASTPSANGI